MKKKEGIIGVKWFLTIGKHILPLFNKKEEKKHLPFIHIIW
jgi:hypothetical protein